MSKESRAYLRPPSVDPVSHLASLASPTVDDLVETIVAWAHARAGTDEIVAAREAFYATHGKFFSEDTFYDSRMSYYLDVLIFERPLPGRDAGGNPALNEAAVSSFDAFMAAVRREPGLIKAEASACLSELARRRHSVFQVVRVNDRVLIAKDLLENDRVEVHPRAKESFRGIARKAIFQGFLYPVSASSYHLSPGFILHGTGAGRIIGKHLRAMRKQHAATEFPRSAILARLALTQLRHLRHRHVDPKVIYAEVLGSVR